MDMFKCQKSVMEKCPDREICGDGTYLGTDCECAKANEAYIARTERQELTAYHATGLSPEEIIKAKGAMESALALAIEVRTARQQIATLKKALKEMSDYLGENDDCPAASIGDEIWPECNGEAEACGDNRTVGECWLRYFTEKVQAEQATEPHGDAAEDEK